MTAKKKRKQTEYTALGNKHSHIIYSFFSYRCWDCAVVISLKWVCQFQQWPTCEGGCDCVTCHCPSVTVSL